MTRGLLVATSLVVAVAVMACKSAPPPRPPAPPQQVEAGSTLTLLSALTFPAGQPELVFQGQRIVAPNAISPALPYCRLVPQVGAPHSLLPGLLRVTDVSYDERESGTTRAMYSITRIALVAGPNQPGYIMSCGWPGAGQSQDFVSTEQIYNAIAGQFTMQLVR